MAHRERFAELLAPERISIDDWPEIRRIWTTKEAGGAGQMGTLNKTLKGADESEIRRFLEIVRYLCWGNDPDVVRIHRVLEDDEMRFTGLGESLGHEVSVDHPPGHSTGASTSIGTITANRQLLNRLDIEEPRGSRAEKQFESTRLLNELTRTVLSRRTQWLNRSFSGGCAGDFEESEKDEEAETGGAWHKATARIRLEELAAKSCLIQQ